MRSSVGVRLNVAVPLVTSAGMVSVKLLTVSKSVPAVAVPPATDTVTEVGPVRAEPSRVPVTVTGVRPSPSETLDGSTDRITFVGAASSSSIVSVAESTSSPFAVPLTVSVSAGSATSSSVGVKSNVAVPLRVFAEIVSVKPGTVP